MARGYDVANTDFFGDLNKFIPNTSERFTAFRRGWDRSVSGTDLEALVAWLTRHRPAVQG